MTVPADEEGLDSLLEFLRESRGFDFANYKRTTLSRRILKRMADVGIESFSDYRDYLEVQTDEYPHLFDTILINVTSFFRDKEAWDYLAASIVPKIVALDRPIRVWSAGCSSGEEAYTIAIVLAEALGEHEFRSRVKIYATDVDDNALVAARQGTYGAKELEPVPVEYRGRYFEVNGQRHVFRPDLRRCVIFGRHDLLEDAPISHLDLLACRNTLMYLNAQAQDGIISRFHYAVNPSGYLFLGRAEMLLTHTQQFKPVSMKNRVFARQPIAEIATLGAGGATNNGTDRDLRPLRLRDLGFEVAPVAQIVADDEGNLVAANDQARAMFGIKVRDIGRSLQDLEISQRPLELRSRIEQANSERRTVHVRGVERAFSDAESQVLDIAVVPLGPADEPGRLGVAVTFTDVTRYSRLQEQMKHSGEELETAYEELHSANEELETSNEELQSTVEELETTNEELSSANEELETLNEELQATNEELETTNEELRSRSTELDVTNQFLSSIVASTFSAVIVVDHGGVIQLWNHRAEEMWGVRSDEAIGRSLYSLDFGLPRAEDVQVAIREATEGRSPEVVDVDAVDRRGRPIRCRITSTPLLADPPTGAAVIAVEEMAGR